NGRVEAVPDRVALPLLGRPAREALGHLEPPAEGAGAVEPLEEVLGQLRILRILHHAVREGGVIAPGAGRPRRQTGVLDVAHQRLPALGPALVLPALGREVRRGAAGGGAALAG